MAASLYIASLEPASGKSVVALGLMEMLSRRLDRVGYFRPVIPSAPDASTASWPTSAAPAAGPDASTASWPTPAAPAAGHHDNRLDLITSRYAVPGDYEELYAYTSEEVAQLIGAGRREDVFKGILAKYRALAQRCEFVLVEGTDYTGSSAALEFDFNAQVANHLGATVLALINGRGKDTQAALGDVRVARKALAAERCVIAATIVNRVSAEQVDTMRAALDRELRDDAPGYVVREEPLLSMPTVGQVAAALGARPLMERAAGGREIGGYLVASMSLPNFLDHLVDGALVIAAGDRHDIIVGSAASQLSHAYPSISGVILSGGLRPEPQIARLVEGLGDAVPPVFLVGTDTYVTARDVMNVPAMIAPDNERKVAAALGLFEASVDLAELEQRVALTRSERVTPLMFEYELIERARADRRRIVLPEGTDERILKAAQLLRRRGAVELTLLGDEADVRRSMVALGLDLDDVPVIDPARSARREEFASRYYELRRSKGVTEESALDTMADVSYFGTMMVALGEADGMVSGAAHTTAHTIRPAFEIIRTRPGAKIVSSVFFMLLPDRVLVYGDCAVNPDPDAEELADISVTSADTATTFGIEPRVAMLSYSTGESGSGESVEKVREAVKFARERRPDLKIDGPIQYDAAVDVSVARAKMPESTVAGQATVFIFPDLDTGNNTYKAVQRSAGAVAVGPVLQGLNKPVNDLSRGCLVSDVINTVAITAIQAQSQS